MKSGNISNTIGDISNSLLFHVESDAANNEINEKCHIPIEKMNFVVLKYKESKSMRQVMFFLIMDFYKTVIMH